MGITFLCAAVWGLDRCVRCSLYCRRTHFLVHMRLVRVVCLPGTPCDFKKACLHVLNCCLMELTYCVGSGPMPGGAGA
ncbi:hypothetical protein COO60DRAFT_555138 [Scenedesmus sp. NREL 46B-D3]|nr:hypothetical protein COO60DRAFT_555138 [Scenedesmus sp. NREL 46B-D3]